MQPASPSSLDHVLRDFTSTLTRSGSGSPALDAELLLAAALRLERNEVLKARILTPSFSVDDGTLLRARELLARRAAHEPMAYILGKKEFFGRDFFVTPATLIPRPDTELLVEEALAFAGESGVNGGAFADLGTGSGAIAVTLALELPLWQGVAIDVSPDALRIAARNAAALGAGGAAPLRFVHADFRETLSAHIPPASLQLLVSNPPYIPEAEYRGLQKDVRLHEPKIALVPGPKGTELARCVIREAERSLAPGGLLLMEMDRNQGETCRALLTRELWEDVTVHKDLAGHDRLIEAHKKPGV